jgi:tyrosyl-DNA phosphodiesterase-1
MSGAFKREGQDLDGGGSAKKAKVAVKPSEPLLHESDDTSLSIKWKGIEGATGYRVQLREKDDLEWRFIKETDPAFLIRETRVKKKNLVTGKAYLFRFRPEFPEGYAGDEYGWSRESAHLIPSQSAEQKRAPAPAPKADLGQGNGAESNPWQPFYLLKTAKGGAQPRALSMSDIIHEEREHSKIKKIFVFSMIVSTLSKDKKQTLLGDWLGSETKWGTHAGKVDVEVFHGMPNKYIKTSDLGNFDETRFFGVMSLCHHSKVLAIFYETGLRLVVLTANMRPDIELTQMTQGAWVQDFPLKESDDDAPESTEFEEDLIEYFLHLQPALKQNHTRDKDAEELLGTLVSALKMVDFSSAEVVLIPSVPGRHVGGEENGGPAMEKLGQAKLREILRKEQRLPTKEEKAKGARLVIGMQPSSITGLGSDESFLKELACSMRGEEGKKQTKEERKARELDDVEVVWPSVRTIGRCRGGYAAGELITAENKTLRDKDEPATFKANLQRVLRHWDGSPSGKAFNAPHIKTFYRYFQAADGKTELMWMYMGSHTLSQAAWVKLEKVGSTGDASQFFIKSYEMGVLWLPSRLKASMRSFSLTPKHPLLGLWKPPAAAGAGAGAGAKRAPRFLVAHTPSPHDGSAIHFPIPHKVADAEEYDWEDTSLDQTPWTTDLEIAEVDCEGQARKGKGKRRFVDNAGAFLLEDDSD